MGGEKGGGVRRGGTGDEEGGRGGGRSGRGGGGRGRGVGVTFIGIEPGGSWVWKRRGPSNSLELGGLVSTVGTLGGGGG